MDDDTNIELKLDGTVKKDGGEVAFHNTKNSSFINNYQQIQQ